ncbi:M48 family metalloprotease [Alloalcanivorax mobilis]|uniref:M48 family metalloprotease n=1 Tax=Alloalcanivorax mobilis TaxID=2019569 RepID=UPI000C75A15A|nr:M48 family metalloprotease [Alloalcanivorax mobilis]
MNFFDQQKSARRRTALLVLYFLLATLAVIASLNLVAWLISSAEPLPLWWRSPGARWLTLAIVLVIACGSLHKAWQLREQAGGLPGLLGAEPVGPRPAHPGQRRLRQVVEEISIAAGTGVPRLYVLSEEHAINAFVTGLGPARASLVVTAGALNALTRDELQGVVAHEFSHILNGDMRLNLRLIALLAGLLAVARLGLYLCDTDHRQRRLGATVLLGLPLVLAGYGGLFCGRLIRAGIARQRERLADASAVQFTRNPGGLAGALIKIQHHGGSYLRGPYAEDVSHMGFAETLSLRWRGWLATHPTPQQRLAALGPDWPARSRARTAPARKPTAAPSTRVGALNGVNLGYAHTLVESIPAGLRHALTTVEGAECVLYTLALGSLEPPPALRAGRRATLVSEVRALGTRLRLPLLDMALPTLRALEESRRRVIVEQLRALTGRQADKDLLCWALAALAERDLAPSPRPPLPLPTIRRLGAVAGEIQVLFSALAWASTSARGGALATFLNTTRGLLPPGRLLLTPDRCRAPRLDAALRRLNRLLPVLKAPLIDCAADLVLWDGQIQVAEAELMRVLCALLECPMPPLFSRAEGTGNSSGSW